MATNFEKALHWENRTRKFVADFQTLFARLQLLIPPQSLYDVLELEGELGQLPVIMADFWWRGYAMEPVVPTENVSDETVKLKMGEYLRLCTTIINFLERIVMHITYEHLSDICHGRILNIENVKLDFIDMYDQVMKNRAEGIEPKWDAHDIDSNPAL